MKKIGNELKKNGILIDIISFGETIKNSSLLSVLIGQFDSDSGSKLIQIPENTKILTDAILSSTLVPRGEENSGGNDYEDDPELAEALRLSLEDEKKRTQTTTSVNKEDIMEEEEDEYEDEDEELKKSFKIIITTNSYGGR